MANKGTRGKDKEILPVKELTDILLERVNHLIEESRQRVVVTINSELTLLYWNIGGHIQEHLLGYERAAYGEQVIQLLSLQLTNRFGNGWGVKHLRHCLRAAETFSNEQILYAVRRQLTWTHLRSLAYVEEELKREFYLEMCAMEHWSTRQLDERIGSMLFERTAISRKPEETIRHDLRLMREEKKLSPELVFRDPYFLDFLGLKDTYSEKDLESAIIAELQRFILEMGNDFAFLARQKRITIDNEDYYIDLLFYHRKLKCLVVIDLKLDKFKASYKGQMELYLRWLEKYESVEGENSPVGLILCSDLKSEHIELLGLVDSNIKVATYFTTLPPLELLQNKLHEAVAIAHQKLENRPKSD